LDSVAFVSGKALAAGECWAEPAASALPLTFRYHVNHKAFDPNVALSKQAVLFKARG